MPYKRSSIIEFIITHYEPDADCFGKVNPFQGIPI
mgnify:FL=1